MSDYIASRIYKAPHFKLAPLQSGRPKQRPPYIIGFDSEAESGKPFMFQFAHPDGHCDIIPVPLKKHAGLGEFFKYLRNVCTRADVEYIVVGWNLQYEWTQLFADLPREMHRLDDFNVRIALKNDPEQRAVLVRALNAKRYTLTAEFGRWVKGNFVPSTKRRVKLIDGYAFLPMALDKAGEILGLGRKEPKPAKFTRANAMNPAFRAYAEQDARLTQKLGDYIIGLHQEYDVSTCVSAPHFASKVFRRAFLTNEIPLPDEDLEQAGLWSYHGGKNGFYLDRPAQLRNIWHYDIRSAYPEAMAQLPDVEQGVWSFTKNYVPHSHSIWKIKARYTNCKYHAFMDEFGKWCRNGVVTTYVTGYEIDAALELGEIKILEASGYVFNGPSGGPLAEYVATFYAQKRNAKTPGERLSAKLHLNSLYGKFFQKIPKGGVGALDMEDGSYIYHDYNEPYDYEAGGLYHPPFASLITGFVRAKIHRLEHHYGAIMTSTDGFFAYQKPDGDELGNDLGMLDAEIGTLRIWRERLYVFTPKGEGKRLYAMHGFRGTLAQLLRMPLRVGLEFHYTAQQMVTLRMAGILHNGKRYAPGEFVTLPYVLRLEPLPP